MFVMQAQSPDPARTHDLCVGRALLFAFHGAWARTHERSIVATSGCVRVICCAGLRDVPVSFGGVTFKPGDWVYAGVCMGC